MSKKTTEVKAIFEVDIIAIHGHADKHAVQVRDVLNLIQGCNNVKLHIVKKC